MARQDDELGQPQDYVEDAEGTESDDESEGIKNGKLAVKSKGKSRRKACEKPEGSDQKRQAFSKRKRGLILKSYQLYKLTDARVFVFIVNDKGSSWAYASPGFAKTLSHTHLIQMREYAQLTGNQRISTEIMPHPHNDAEDKRIDDRPTFQRPTLGDPGSTPTTSRGPAPTVVAQPDVVLSNAAPSSAAPGATTATVAAAVASAAAAGRRMNAAVAAATAAGMPPQPTQLLSTSPSTDNAGPRDTYMGPETLQRRRGSSKLTFHRDDEALRDEDLGERDAGVPARLGSGTETIITPSGRRMAAAVGISLSADAGQDPSKEEESDMPPPSPRCGVTMMALDRATAVAVGLPPPSKQARYREPSNTASDGMPPLLPNNPTQQLGIRSRRGEPPLPPFLPPPVQRHARSIDAPDLDGSLVTSPPNSLELHASGNNQNRGHQLRQMAAAAAMYQQAQTLAGMATVAVEEDLRSSGGLPPTSRGAFSSGPTISLAPQLLRPMPSHASSSRLPFTSGDIVRGNDGQLYRVLQELVDPEDLGPPDHTPAAARVLMLQPSGQSELYITSSQILGGDLRSAFGTLRSR